MYDITLRELNQSWAISSMLVGVEIRSMSKRIMNKMFSCADDCGVICYYQGADSAHLIYDGVDGIVKDVSRHVTNS